MDSIAVLILAAGLGKRMGLDIPKVAVKTGEKPVLEHVLDAAFALAPAKIVVITGHGADLVQNIVKGYSARAEIQKKPSLHFAYQAEQKGTGHAVQCALPELKDFVGTALILAGDVPLIQVETLKALLAIHKKSNATLSLLTFKTHHPHAYGRVLRNSAGNIERVVEAKDCSAQQLLVDELNAAIYAVDSAFLAPAVNSLTNKNAQNEYYLTDIVEKASKEGQIIASTLSHDFEEVQGINTLQELALVNQSLMKRRVRNLISSGVHVEDPASLFVDADVSIAAGVRIGPNVQIRGASKIEMGVVFEGNAYLIDTIVEEGAVLKLGLRAEGAKIGRGAQIGPFAHLRPGTVLDEDVKIGNFVETKNSHLHAKAKAPHLTYLGDATIGKGTNIGAGTITCNYDGFKKSKTTIGEDVFIGSNSSLVAPVVIEDGATVGAGSVITKRVERDSLALTRAPQESKPGWSKRKREKGSK